MERQSYQDELERLSEMTLELVEEYMSQMDLDNEDLNDNPFMWGGGNLGPEETDKKTYDEWLNHFGVDDDEEDFSGLPELCDNEQAAAAAKTRDVKSQDKAEADDLAAEGAEDHSSQLGEWEDVLGSGR